MSEHNARRWDVSGDEYHAPDDIYGKSMLDQFRESPQLFHGRYVTGEFPMKQQTAMMKFGSDFDIFLLEKEAAVAIPSNVLSESGSKAGAAWKEFATENEGKLLLKTAEHDAFLRMADNIRNHPDANTLLLASGCPQVAIRWEDPDTGLPLKCRMDNLQDGRIVDLKTCANPLPFPFHKQIEELGYFRQAAMYCWGMQLLTGKPHTWAFVAIRNTLPYDVRTYTIDVNWLQDGMDEIRDTLTKLKAAFDTDVWLPEGHGTTVKLSRPNYAKYKSEWELTDE